MGTLVTPGKKVVCMETCGYFHRGKITSTVKHSPICCHPRIDVPSYRRRVAPGEQKCLIIDHYLTPTRALAIVREIKEEVKNEVE